MTFLRAYRDAIQWHDMCRSSQHELPGLYVPAAQLGCAYRAAQLQGLPLVTFCKRNQEARQNGLYFILHGIVEYLVVLIRLDVERRHFSTLPECMGLNSDFPPWVRNGLPAEMGIHVHCRFRT